jgi:hypothetical protein
MPNHTIVSAKSILTVELDSILPTAIRFVTNNKRRVIRTLPHELAVIWSTTLCSILSNTLLSLTTRRQLFFLAPHLLSCYSTNLHSSADFKALRFHLTSLRDATYLAQVIADITVPQSPCPRRDTDEEKRIKTLASRGLFGRIVRDEDISVADPSSVPRDRVEQLFPQDTLPAALIIPPTTNHTITMSFADIAAAARHLSRGKASGLSGWTRELFTPLLHCPIPAFHNVISEIFTSIVNVVELSADEQNLLTSSWLCLLQYKSKPQKLRPICIRDFLSKLVWTHLISNNRDLWCHVSGSSYRKKGGCAAVAQALQAILDSDRFFVALDAENAFNCCSRQHVFAYVLSRGNLYYDMFPFLNLFYATFTVVHAFSFTGGVLYTIRCSCGAAQGCSSGPFFFHLCILHINHRYPKSIVNVADDIYVTQPEGLMIADILRLLALSGLRINTTKCAIIGSRTILASNIVAGVRQHLQDCKQVSPAPFFALGTILIPDWPLALGQRVTYINGSLDLICGKIRRRLDTLQSLDTSFQIKFLTLRDIQLFCLYQLQAVSHFIVDQLCKYLEDIFGCVLENLLGYKIPQDRHHLLYKPLEVGGLGFIPFSDLCSGLRENVQQYIAPILDGMKIDHQYTITPSKSLSWLWRHITSTRALSSPQRSQDEVSDFCWLSTWPNLGIRRFSDREFAFILSHLLRLLPSVATICVFKGITFNYATSSPSERHQHWFSCGRCGSAQFHHRHECTLSQVTSTSKYHNIVTSKYPPNMPVPGKNKGGPDFLIITTNNTLSSSSLVGDVAITNAARMSSVFAAKMKQYKSFSPAINGTTFPFVLNTRGIVYRKTISVMKDKHLAPAFIRDVCINAACAMLKGLVSSYFNLTARPADNPLNTTLTESEDFDEQPTQDDDDAEDDL